METIAQHLGTWERLQAIVLEPFNLIILFLFAVGLTLKQTQKFPDWAIVFSVPLLGVVAAIGYLHFETGKMGVMAAGMLGYFYGMLATHLHNLLKQALESPLASQLMKLPMMPLIAGLLGVEIPQPTQTPPPTK